MPNVTYTVTLDGDAAAARDVRGLPGEEQIAEYRHGNSPVFYPIKMPGLGHVRNILVYDVVFMSGSPFGRWAASTDGSGGREITISAQDEVGIERVVWTLHSAHPLRPVEARAGGASRVAELEVGCAGIDVIKGRT